MAKIKISLLPIVMLLAVLTSSTQGSPTSDTWPIDGLHAPRWEDGGRVTRCLGMSAEEFGRAVGDYYARFNFHIFEYPTDVSFNGLVLLSQATGDPKYQNYVRDQFDYYLEHKRGNPPFRGEHGETFLQPNEAEFRELKICPWCSRSDISPWRQKQYRPPFRWLEYRDGEPIVNVWAFYNLPGQRSLTSFYMAGKDKRILDLVDVAGQRRRAQNTIERPEDPFRQLLIDGAPGAGTTARVGVITGEDIFFDAAARHILQYRIMLDPDTKLFYQGWSYPLNKVWATPVVWGRGSGWWAWGAAVTLSHLPKDHPGRPAILDLFLENMAALKKYQDSAGMWHQSVDHWDSWPETSGTGLIVSAMARGVREGFLPQEYRQVALKGLEGLKGHVDSNGLVRDCCVGTGAQDTVHDYYARPMPPQDPHAAGPVINAAAEVLLMLKGSKAIVP